MLEVARAVLSVQSKVSKKVAWVGLIDWVRCVEQMGNNIVFPNQNPTFEVCTDRLGARAVRRTKNVAFINYWTDRLDAVRRTNGKQYIFYQSKSNIFVLR